MHKQGGKAGLSTERCCELCRVSGFTCEEQVPWVLGTGVQVLCKGSLTSAISLPAPLHVVTYLEPGSPCAAAAGLPIMAFTTTFSPSPHGHWATQTVHPPEYRGWQACGICPTKSFPLVCLF